MCYIIQNITHLLEGKRHTISKTGRKGTVVLYDSLNARLVVACVLWNKEIDLSGRHDIAWHKSSLLQIQNKVYPSSGSSLLFSVALPLCIFPLGLTNTYPSVEDGIVRISSSPCLLYRAVNHMNTKILGQQVKTLLLLGPIICTQECLLQMREIQLQKLPLLYNAWDKGIVLLQPHSKLIPESCNPRKKGLHWILATTDVHKWTASNLEACTALLHKTCRTEETWQALCL